MPNGRRVLLVCRCGKKCYSFKEWERHLKTKHSKWHKELEGSGDLDEDRQVFRRERGRS